MGNTTSIPETIDADEITSKTGSTIVGLSKKQISALWTRFLQLDRDSRGEPKGYLDVDDLRRVPKFEANPIAPRLIRVIFDDFGSDGKLNFTQFVTFMSTFGQDHRHALPIRRVPKDSEESAFLRKINFIFRMYDVDHDGILSKGDIEEILKMMVGKISNDEASIIAEKVIAEFTDDQPNSTVTVENFKRALATIDFDDKMSLKLLK